MRSGVTIAVCTDLSSVRREMFAGRVPINKFRETFNFVSPVAVPMVSNAVNVFFPRFSSLVQLAENITTLKLQREPT